MGLLRRLVISVVFGVMLTLVSGLYAKEFNWPDYYHIEYGFPVAWLVRTLSTIIGPTNSLAFQTVSFVLDWAFWSVVAGILLVLLKRLRSQLSL